MGLGIFITSLSVVFFLFPNLIWILGNMDVKGGNSFELEADSYIAGDKLLRITRLAFLVLIIVGVVIIVRNR